MASATRPASRPAAPPPSVPRELFVPESFRHAAYADRPLPIEAGQTISQPYIVALMIEAAALAPDDRALEVGAGSGYATAVMSPLHSGMGRCRAWWRMIPAMVLAISWLGAVASNTRHSSCDRISFTGSSGPIVPSLP